MHFRTVRSQACLIHTTSKKIQNKNFNLQKSETNEQSIGYAAQLAFTLHYIT